MPFIVRIIRKRGKSMKIYELIGTDFVRNKIFPMGSTVLVRENGDTIVCVTFSHMRKTEPIPV